MKNKIIIGCFLLLAIAIALLTIRGWEPKADQLIVYAGKGLKNAVEEIKQGFEEQEGIPLKIIYKGSNTLLSEIQKTRTGDIFIPGSQTYLEKAGKLVIENHYVGVHVPAFAVKYDNPKKLKRYSDLKNKGIRIAVADPEKAAIGRVTVKMILKMLKTDTFAHNIVLTSATVNDLMQALNDDTVDAILIWSDMARWDHGMDLELIGIPENLNQIKEIQVGLLSTSKYPKQAKRLADYVATKGPDIFILHGFKKSMIR